MSFTFWPCCYSVLLHSLQLPILTASPGGCHWLGPERPHMWPCDAKSEFIPAILGSTLLAPHWAGARTEGKKLMDMKSGRFIIFQSHGTEAGNWIKPEARRRKALRWCTHWSGTSQLQQEHGNLFIEESWFFFVCPGICTWQKVSPDPSQTFHPSLQRWL